MSLTSRVVAKESIAMESRILQSVVLSMGLMLWSTYEHQLQQAEAEAEAAVTLATPIFPMKELRLFH